MIIAFKTIGHAQNVILAKLKNVVIQFMNISFKTIGPIAQNVNLAKLKIDPLETFRQYLQTEKVLHPQNLEPSPTIPLVFHRVDIERKWKLRKLEAIEVVIPVDSHRVETETEQGVQFYNHHFNNVHHDL